MEKAGWVKRKTDPKDRRANQLYLTDKINPVVQEMRALGIALRQQVTDGITAQEHRLLLDLLQRMQANVATLLDKKDEAA